MKNYDIMMRRKTMKSKISASQLNRLHPSTHNQSTHNCFKLMQNLGEELSVPLQTAEYISCPASHSQSK